MYIVLHVVWSITKNKHKKPQYRTNETKTKVIRKIVENVKTSSSLNGKLMRMLMVPNKKKT